MAFYLVTLRKDVESENAERIEKLKKEKEDVEEKLFSKKKDMKEQEQAFVKQCSNLERDIALLQERLNSAEQSKKEMLENYEREMNSLNSLSKNLKGDHKKELEDILKNSENLKIKVQTLTNELQAQKTQNEKDKILWENRFEHLEHQRDTYKRELNECQERFDKTLENLQKKHTDERERSENNYNEKTTNMENKYTTQIKELNDKHSKLYSDLLENNKALEKELKSTKIDLDLKTKSFDPTASQKTIEELNQEIEKLKSELDLTKKSSLGKTNEVRLQLEKDKESLKGKIVDLENKIKEMETKRSNTLFESELERGKWNNEREHLASTINELKDTIETLTSKNERLTKENEKLKNEKSSLGRNKVIGRFLDKGLNLGGLGRGTGGSNPYSNIVESLAGNKSILETDLSGIQNTSSSNKYGKYMSNKGNDQQSNHDDSDFK